MGERPGDPARNRATLAATKATAHAWCDDRDAAIACAQTAEALYDLAATQDLLADALRVGLEECEALRAERDSERLDATGFRLLLLGDYAALGRALGLGSAPLTLDQATEAARALLVERNALRAALATQAAAVRQHEAAQATLCAADARDAATLRRREATPGDALAELAAAREEARQWNARATELETERDETLRRVRAALVAFGVADCDDPIAALEALAEEVPQCEAEALNDHNTAVLRAHAEGRAAGLREAMDACHKVKGRLLDVAMDGGGSLRCAEAFGDGDEYEADEEQCEFVAAGASMCAEAIEAMITEVSRG